jgi:N6-adenosine-specific RNA methylase IME4
MKRLDFLAFSDIKFDVMLMKIPYNWSLDDMQNTLRFDLISESPSFVVLGCGDDIKKL